MIKWTTHKDTIYLISRIAKRAVALAQAHDIKYKQMDAVMDIDGCHSNGNPLRLNDLLIADEFNFAHDIFGIRNNINRKTGKMENCFVPRHSA